MDSLAGELPVLVVGFDGAPEPRPGPWLVDRDRELYARLGMRRAPWWRIYSPATLAFYARATTPRRAAPDGAPVDVRQLGGDAVVVGGVAVRRWLPRTPVDRVAPAVVVAAARELRAGQTDSM